MFHRANAAAVLFTGVLAIFFALLWNIQIVHGAEYDEAARRSFVQTETVPAARGRLLDRKGRVLAEDRAVWTAHISENAGEKTVERIKALCKEEGITWDREGELGPVPASLLAKVKGGGLNGVTFSPAEGGVGNHTVLVTFPANTTGSSRRITANFSIDGDSDHFYFVQY